MIHKGDNHTTKIEVSPQGWKSEVELKSKGSSIKFSLEGNKNSALDDANLELALKL
ncbi:MAG: hypothetical protein U5K00_00060 [Melioribacteraceae bacterium]|nr:hypothetical protein [Melioribacteraceae bacterium]